MAYIGKEPIVGNFQKCDAITVVNGQAAYTLQVSSTNVVPESVNHMLVSLNGILQAPTTSFTVSGSTLTFVSNLATGDVIDFVILLGNVLDLGTPSDGTVTNAKLAQDIISGETALTVPPATTDEFLVSDAGTLKRIDYSLLGNTPAFAVYSDNDQTLSENAYTKIEWDNEAFDTNSAFASHKFTVPANQAGKYMFAAQVTIDCNAADHFYYGVVRYYVNGSAIVHGLANLNMATGYGAGATINSTIGLDLSAADYVEVYAYIDDIVDTSVKSTYSSFSGFKIIGA